MLSSKILLWNNDPSDTSSINSALLELGFSNISTVNNEIDFFFELQQHTYVVIIINTLSEENLQYDLLSSTTQNKIPVIVITTSTSIYTYQYINQQGNITYLVKPIHKLTLGTTLKLLSAAYNINRSIYITGKHNERVKIYFNDIHFLEVEGNYCFVCTQHTKYAIKTSLTKLLEELDDRFIRVHHSFIVNSHHIISFTADKIHLKQWILPLSRTYKKEFLRRING